MVCKLAVPRRRVTRWQCGRCTILLYKIVQVSTTNLHILHYSSCAPSLWVAILYLSFAR